MSVLELEQEILKLDLNSQLYIADSLNKHFEDNSDDYDKEWDNEIQRRVKSIEDGTASLIDFNDVKSKIEERYK